MEKSEDITLKMNKRLTAYFVVFLVALTCVAALDIGAYGGILGSGYVYFYIIGIAWFIRVRRKSESTEILSDTKLSKRQIIICIAVLAALIIIVHVLLNPYVMMYRFVYCAGIVLVVEIIVGYCGITGLRRIKIVFFSLLASFIAVAALFCLISGIPTRWQAEISVENMGYSDAEWITSTSTLAFNESFLDMEREWHIGNYLLYGEKNSEKYKILYDTERNRIIEAAEIENIEEIKRGYEMPFELIPG